MLSIMQYGIHSAAKIFRIIYVDFTREKKWLLINSYKNLKK